MVEVIVLLKIFPNSFDERFVSEFNIKYSGYTRDLIKEANEFLDGKVDVFGIECDIETLLDDIDPTTGERWPRIHYKDYRFHAGAAPGDVKFTWEYMKHYFLVVSAKAYILTKDDRYVLAGKKYIEDWLEKTEDWIGVSWVGHVHICQRMYSWFSWLDMTKDATHILDAAFYAKVDEYIRKQEQLLSEEYENPRNNHKLVSIVTVILCHLHFNRFELGQEWFTRLEETVSYLMYADGGFTEQSTSYHRLCVEALLILGIALKNHGASIPDFILTAIERSLKYFAALATPEGLLPIFGDNSNEILIKRQSDFWEMEYLFQLAASNELGITVRSIDTPDLDVLFYLGDFDVISEPFIGSRSFAFPITGHYLIKDDKDYAFLRAGEFGMYQPNSRSGHPHSHCDQLGLILFLDGMEILTDPGTYRYNESDFERMIMKDESFHSTFLIDNSHQGIYTSSFSYAEAIDGKGYIDNDSIVGSLEIGGVLAQRRVNLNEGACLIEDEYLVKDGKDHKLEVFFCIHPRFTVVKADENKVVLQHIGTSKYLAIDHNTGVKPETRVGYVSREYNQVKPNQRLVFRMSLIDAKRLRFKLHFVPTKD